MTYKNGLHVRPLYTFCRRVMFDVQVEPTRGIIDRLAEFGKLSEAGLHDLMDPTALPAS
jgi:hypothetical protein